MNVTAPYWWLVRIYIIITKNIRYLLWNWGVWRFFHDVYLTIEVHGIQCTNHLHESCPLTDIISKLTADGLLWRHRHMGQPLAIVTSQWPIVPTGIYGRMMLRSARVEGIAIICLFILLHFRTPVFQHRASLVSLVNGLVPSGSKLLPELM